MSASELRRPILIPDDYYGTYSVQTPKKHEKPSTPIFQCSTNLQILDKIFLVVLTLIFIAGLSIGVYLLASEGHERRASGPYNITTRELWKAHVPASTIPKLKLPAERVLFLRISSNTCNSTSLCAAHILDLQLKHMRYLKEPDILYNFIISTNGDIFEGRGWEFQTSRAVSTSSNLVAVAFLEKLHGNVPTPKQAESARLFVDAAVMEGKIGRCFNISVYDENTFFLQLARNIESSLSSCLI